MQSMNRKKETNILRYMIKRKKHISKQEQNQAKDKRVKYSDSKSRFLDKKSCSKAHEVPSKYTKGPRVGCKWPSLWLTAFNFRIIKNIDFNYCRINVSLLYWFHSYLLPFPISYDLMWKKNVEESCVVRGVAWKRNEPIETILLLCII